MGDVQKADMRQRVLQVLVKPFHLLLRGGFHFRAQGVQILPGVAEQLISQHLHRLGQIQRKYAGLPGMVTSTLHSSTSSIDKAKGFVAKHQRHLLAGGGAPATMGTLGAG